MLSQAFKLAFPHQVYKTDTARQRFLQMPVACIRVGTPGSGKEAWYLIQYVEGVDYVNFLILLKLCSLLISHLSQLESTSLRLMHYLDWLSQTGRESLFDTL